MPAPYQPDIRMIVIPFHVAGLDAIVRIIRRYTYPKGEAISDRTYNAGSGTPRSERYLDMALIVSTERLVIRR
jgi:hypothetical protein